MTYKKTVAVDLDGVLAKYDEFRGPETIDEPIPGAKDFLKKLSAKYAVIVHTARQTETAVNWLREHDLLSHVDAVNYCQINGRAGKPVAIAYVDDRAIRFEGVYSYVLREVDKLAENNEKKDNGGYYIPPGL